MKLIVGLCNPDERFNLTRHNSGKMVVDSFIKRLELGSPAEKYLGAFWGACRIDDEDVAFLEPHTYASRITELS